jgi:hypothetical protein
MTKEGLEIKGELIYIEMIQVPVYRCIDEVEAIPI